MYELHPASRRRAIFAVPLRDGNLAPAGLNENSPAIHRREIGGANVEESRGNE